jgi:uncharacterized membrane protein HdeD (DUF308 family)
MVEATPASTIPARLSRYWWLFLVRGLFGLALGVFALVYPTAMLGLIVLFIGAYLIVDGIIAVAKALRILRTDRHWWALLLEGILGIAVGIIMFALPLLSILSLALLVGFWAILSGVFALMTAIRLRVHVPGESLYVLFGIVSIVFGIAVAFAPAVGLFYIVLMTSVYGFVMGLTMIALAFRVRQHAA